MELIITENYEEASQAAADIMIEQIKDKPDSVLGLATGSTPIKLYELMIEDCQKNGTSYKDVKTYNLDEYFGLAADHEQSYHYFMQTHLFHGLDIKPENTHVPEGQGNIEENCETYNKMLSENPIDLQLLGIGSNGHIGFNEPGESFDSVTHQVALKESTIKDNARLFFNNDINAVPTKAITMGIKNIMDAKKVLLIACGENKAEPIRALVTGEITEDVPATVLNNHDNVVVIIDKAAAKLLNIA